MPDIAELERMAQEIERLEGGGHQAIASAHKAKILVEQIKASLAAKESADRYSRVLVALSIVLVILTLALVVLTVALVRHGG